MLEHACRIIVACIALGALPAASAKLSVFRIEVHPVPTLNLTTAQVLNAETSGPAGMIAGELRLPATAALRVPAVIVLHGDAGAIANQAAWNDAFTAAGIAVFTLDSFTGRDAISATATIGPIEGAAKVTGFARVVDAYRALALLSQHPRIDSARIALMGFSSGGTTALNSAMTRFAPTHAAPNTAFAAYIALYPACNIRLSGDAALKPVPVRIFHGAADVITLAVPCRDYAQRLRSNGVDIEFMSFADAHHGFDNPLGVPLNRAPQVPNTAGCMFEERSGGIVNAATGKPVVIGDECVHRGLIGGYNEAAYRATRQVVEALLRRVFKLSQ